MKQAATEAAWNDLSESQRVAIVHKICKAGGEVEDGGLEVLNKILRCELGIELRDLVVKLVDQNGRSIPPAGFGFEVVDANRKFYLIQPAIDYSAVLARLQQYFAEQMTFVTAVEFQVRSEALIKQIRGNTQVSNLLLAPHFPIVLPKHCVGDYGRSLEETFLSAAGRSYEKAFPRRKFTNYQEGKLAGNVKIAEGSRHDQLVVRMLEQAVVGIYFPCMQGFGIKADRAMVKLFPEGFLLSGGIDTAMAITAYPEALARDFNTPALDCAANEYSSGLSLLFTQDDDVLGFNSRFLGALDGCAGGLLFVG